jgi:hypothetical protein
MSEATDTRRVCLVIGAIMIRPGSELEEQQVWLTRKGEKTSSTLPLRMILERYPSMSRDELAAKLDEYKANSLKLFDKLDGFKLEMGDPTSAYANKGAKVNP